MNSISFEEDTNNDDDDDLDINRVYEACKYEMY